MEDIKDKAPITLLALGIVLIIIGRGVDSDVLTGIGLVVTLSCYVVDSIFNGRFMGD